MDGLGFLCGISVGYLSKLENDNANPTWSTLVRLASALNCRPSFHLLPDAETVALTAAEIANLTPTERLERQPLQLLELFRALEWGARHGMEYAVVGEVAGLLQGLPVPVRTLRVLVLDSDASLAGLELMLIEGGLLFNEVGPDRLREWPERTWALWARRAWSSPPRSSCCAIP